MTRTVTTFILIALLLVIFSVQTAYGQQPDVYLSDQDLITTFTCEELDATSLLGRDYNSRMLYTKYSGEVVCQLWTGGEDIRDSTRHVNIKVWEWTDGSHEAKFYDENGYQERIDRIQEQRDYDEERDWIKWWKWLTPEGWSFGTVMEFKDELANNNVQYHIELELVAKNGTLHCSGQSDYGSEFDEQEIIELCNQAKDVLLIP